MERIKPKEIALISSAITLLATILLFSSYKEVSELNLDINKTDSIGAHVVPEITTTCQTVR